VGPLWIRREREAGETQDAFEDWLEERSGSGRSEHVHELDKAQDQDFVDALAERFEDDTGLDASSLDIDERQSAAAAAKPGRWVTAVVARTFPGARAPCMGARASAVSGPPIFAAVVGG